MIKSAVTDGTTRSADCETPVVEEIAATITIFGSFINDLIERREDVIGELDLCNQNWTDDGSSIAGLHRTGIQKRHFNYLQWRSLPRLIDQWRIQQFPEIY